MCQQNEDDCISTKQVIWRVDSLMGRQMTECKDVWETRQSEGMVGGQRAEGRMNEKRQLGRTWSQHSGDRGRQVC